MKTITLITFFSILLVGCRDDNTEAQSTPESSPSASTPSRWLQTCVNEFARNKTHENRWFNGIGANDVCLMPGENVLEDIFQTCQKISPLSDANVPIYKSWLKNCIAEMGAITPGTPRTQVDQTLLQNGGLSTFKAAIYSHRECTVLKVRVEFDENNRVKAICAPYLGLFIAD